MKNLEMLQLAFAALVLATLSCRAQAGYYVIEETEPARMRPWLGWTLIAAVTTANCAFLLADSTPYLALGLEGIVAP